MMLNEMRGMRVQTTSPGIGAATVRVQGMRGRYTRFFSDGLPLFGSRRHRAAADPADGSRRMKSSKASHLLCMALARRAAS
jgi:hypothetical protein